MEEYQIVYVEKPEESAWGILGNGIDTFNKQQAGEYQFQRLCVALQTAEQEIMGGALGELYWGWFHLDLLWVKEEIRHHGFGGRLLARIEDEACQRGAKGIFLDTFSFQAPAFYQKHGYRIFGELPDFPEGHQRYFLEKRF